MIPTYDMMRTTFRDNFFFFLDTLATCSFFPSIFSILQQSSPHSLSYSFLKILLLFIPKGLQKS